MLLGYGQPQSIVWTLLDSTFVGDGGAENLSDADPSSRARFQWPTVSAPAITDYVRLRASWSALDPRVPRIAGLFDFLLDFARVPGLKIEVRGKLVASGDYTYALGGNSLSQRTTELVDGSVSAAWIFDEGLAEVNGLEFRIFNDVDGEALLDGTSFVDIGEGFGSHAVDLCVSPGFREGHIDPTVRARTLNSQLKKVFRRSYRTLDGSLAGRRNDEVRNSGLDGGTDWDKIAQSLLGATHAMVIMRWQNSDNSPDYESAQRDAMLAVLGEPMGRTHMIRQLYNGTFRFEELPAGE